jgi:SulP family sulfate permease
VCGLYSAVVVAALAALFGSSALLVYGPTNAISLVVLSAVAGVGIGPADPERIGLVALLGALAGLIQITLALLRLGGLARHVSEAVILGFLAGAAVLEALSQVPSLLGLLPVGGVDPRALVVGLVTLALVIGLHRLGQRWRMKLPSLLLSLVFMSVLAWLLGLGHGGEGAVVGGFPVPRLPSLGKARVPQVAAGALSIALLGLVETLAIARSLAVRSGQPVDCNRQCLADGLSNLGGGLFQALPGGASLSRSAINYQAGAATRLSGVVAAAVVAVSVWLFAPLVRFVPPAVLAGVLLWTAWRIVDRRRLWACMRTSRTDAAVVLATVVTAVFIRIELSVLVGVLLSLLFRAIRHPTQGRESSALALTQPTP